MAEPKTPTEDEVAIQPVDNEEQLDDLAKAEQADHEAEQAELDALLADDEDEDEPEAPAPVVPEPAPVADLEDKLDQPSRREQMRIQDLLRKYPQPETPKVPTPTGIDYANDLNAEPEVAAQLQADRDRAAQAAYQQGLEQSNTLAFETRLEIDAPRVETKYPFLDPNSDKFDASAAQDLNVMYLSLAGYDSETRKVANPNLRYATFTEAMVNLANKIADRKVATAAVNVKKQAAKTGLRPDGSRPKKQVDPSTMSDEDFNKLFNIG